MSNSNIEYGISEVAYGDNSPAKTIMFGDGLTAIHDVSWEDKVTCGVVISRGAENCPSYPFEHLEKDNGDAVVDPHDFPEMEKVYILFDNIKSVDAMQAMLSQARSRLIDKSLKKVVDVMNGTNESPELLEVKS